MTTAKFFELNEIVFQIFEYLPAKQIIELRKVSKTFDKCAKDEYLWSRIIKRNDMIFKRDCGKLSKHFNGYFDPHDKKYTLCKPPYHLSKNWNYTNSKWIYPKKKSEVENFTYSCLIYEITSEMDKRKKFLDRIKRARKARIKEKWKTYRWIILFTILIPPIGVYLQGHHYFNRMDDDDDEDINYLGVGCCTLLVDLIIHICLTILFTIVGLWFGGIVYGFIAWGLQHFAYEMKYSKGWKEGDGSFVSKCREKMCVRCMTIGDFGPYLLFCCINICSN